MKRTPFKPRATPFSKRKSSSLKTKTVSLKRGKLRKVGRVGKANLEANKILALRFAGVTQCELRLPGCFHTWLLQRVHRHKRAWYKGDVAKLSNYQQVVIGCQHCHDRIEHDAELTEAVFNELRGPEHEIIL